MDTTLLLCALGGVLFIPGIVFSYCAYAQIPLPMQAEDFTATSNTSSPSQLKFNDTVIGFESQIEVKKYIAIMRTDKKIQQSLMEIYKPYMDEEDVALSHPNEQNLKFTKQLPGEHGVQYFSIGQIKSKVATLKAQGVRIIAYDLEKQYSPNKDLLDPVASIKTASQIAHKNKMKLMVSPSFELTQKYGAQFAKFVDIYNIQAQSLQSKPNEYKNFVDKTVDKLRKANPEILICSQVSTARGSLDSMKSSISQVVKLVDGATSWYSLDEKGLDKLEKFVKWFNDNYS